MFDLQKQQTSLQREAIGGATTFMTMAYIIFVQPAVLSSAGMDFGAVMTATCLSAALATLIMGLYANYPVALAPGMGQNFFFTFTVVLTMGIAWQKALGVIFIAGVIFILLSFFSFREKVINAIPRSLQSAIAVGIGLMITLIGLEWSGIVVDAPGVLVGLGDFGAPSTLLSLAGLAVTAILLVRSVPGAMLIGILFTTIIGLIFGLIQYHGIFSTPPDLSPTFLQLDILGALNWELAGVIFTFLVLDLFDTVGTLVGVAGEADLLKDGKLPRAEKALLSDAVGTAAGAILGTSTVTSYVESASGVASGARTGLANLFTAALFLLALFVSPLVKMIGGGVEVAEGVFRYPTIAPVLILVGVYMVKSIRHIDWQDLSEAIPAFLTFIIIPFSFRITEGIAVGFISYVLLKSATGKAKDIPILLWVFAIVFLLRYVFIPMG